MISLKQFTTFIEGIDKFYKREEQLNRAFGEFNTSYTIVEFCPEIVDSILQFLKEVFEDEDDWIGYWIYELEMGNRKDLGCFYKTGESIKLDTIEDLFNFLLENMENE